MINSFSMETVIVKITEALSRESQNISMKNKIHSQSDINLPRLKN